MARKAKKAVTIKRGSCRVVRGKVRVCASKTGKIYTSVTPRRKPKRKRKKTTKKYKKPAKPKKCVSKPSVRGGQCKCRGKKTKKNPKGKVFKLKIRYCRKPKR